MRTRSRALAPGLAIAAALLGGSASVVGCGHAQASPPDVVREFALAVERGDHDRAYALTSADYRRRVSLAKFRAELEGERPEVARDAAALSRASLRARAEVETAAGERVPLILEGGAWRLGEQPLAPFGQQSPRAALRTFVRAIEARRYDVLLRLVPARHRSRVTEDALQAYWEGPDAALHRRLLEVLRRNLEAPIIDLGTEAQMPYGPQVDQEAYERFGRGTDGQSDHQSDPKEGEVRFLLEDGIWKIEDAG